nr:hypothetical protein [Microbacterium lemovicicum]
MSFETNPRANATISVPTPVVVTPGYSTTYPAVQEMSLDFANIIEGTQGFGVYPGSSASTSRGGTGRGGAVGHLSVTQFNANTVQQVFRPLTGLTVGRSYTLRMWVMANVSGQSIGVKLWTNGSAVPSSTTVDGTDYVLLTHTFTPTATSVDMYIGMDYAGAIRSIRVDDVTLTRNSYTVVTPSVTTLTPVLPISEGTVTMDTGWSPYVQASVTVPLTTLDLLERINPDVNKGQRVKIKASAAGSYVTTPPTYSEWTTARTNIAPNPRMQGSGYAISRGGGAATSTFQANGGPTDALTSWRKDTYTTAPTSSPLSYWFGPSATSGIPVLANTEYTFSAYAKASVQFNAVRLDVVWYNASGTTLSTIATAQPSFDVVGEWERRSRTLTSPSGAAFARVGIAFSGSGTMVVGEHVGITGLLIETGAVLGEFFDGNTINPDVLTQTAWTGTANASSSILQTRAVTTATKSTWVPSDEREFDLVLRRREVSHDQKTLRLDLESDERLLQGYAQLTDDTNAYLRQDSLRSIVNYVLGKVIPGTTLQTTGAPDVPFYTLSDSVNLYKDPRVTADHGTPTNVTRTYDTSWPGVIEGAAHNGILLTSPTSNDSYVSIGGDTGGMRLGMTAGKSYYVSATGVVKSTIGGTGPSGTDANTGTVKNRQRAIVIHAMVGGVYRVIHSNQVTNTVGSAQRVSVVFNLPANTTEAFVRFYHGGTSGSISWSQFRLTETDERPGVENQSYFWGGKPATPDYTYSWTGASDNSTSRRTPRFDRSPELLLWDAGKSAADFLMPIVAAAGYRLVCDEQRRWWLLDPALHSVSGRFTAMPQNTTKGTDTVDLAEQTGVDGVIVEYRWINDQGLTQVRKDTAGASGRVYKETVESRYPGPGRAAAILARRTGQGRQQDVIVASDFRIQPWQEVAISLPGTGYQLGNVTSVQWGLSTGTMGIASTGLRNTLAGAVDLLPGTIDGLSGTIDSL